MAVIDGSTSKTSFSLRPNITNGKLAADVLANAIKHLPRRSSMRQMAIELTKELNELYKMSDLKGEYIANHPENRLTASVAIYSDYRHIICLFGDCQAMVDGVLFSNPKPYEEALAEKRSNILKTALREGATSDDLLTNDVGRNAIVNDLIKAMKEGQNKKYMVLDGTPPYLQGVKVVSLGSGQHDIVLATDGYPKLMPNLYDSEKALKELLLTDPLCISKYKATKGKYRHQYSFDDRAYIRFSI